MGFVNPLGRNAHSGAQTRGSSRAGASSGAALLRVVIGALFVGHGTQKLTRRVGGEGLDVAAERFAAVGLRPGRAHATNAGVSQIAAGALLAGGLLTPLATSMVSANMIVAARYVHGRNGLWLSNDGAEYLLVLAAGAFAVAAAGPGPGSLDERLGIVRSGTGVALLQLAAGALGAEAAVRLASALAPADTQPA